MSSTRENEELFSRALTPRTGGSMRTEFPKVNAMGARPLDQPMANRGYGGNPTRGEIGETRATGIVAEGRFGGSREMEGKVRAYGGRKSSRREGRR